MYPRIYHLVRLVASTVPKICDAYTIGSGTVQYTDYHQEAVLVCFSAKKLFCIGSSEVALKEYTIFYLKCYLHKFILNNLLDKNRTNPVAFFFF